MTLDNIVRELGQGVIGTIINDEPWKEEINKFSDEVNTEINALLDKLMEMNRRLDEIHYINTYGDLKPHIVRAPDKSGYALTWVSDEGEIFVKPLGKKKFKMYVGEGDYLAVKRFRKMIVFDTKTGEEIIA